MTPPPMDAAGSPSAASTPDPATPDPATPDPATPDSASAAPDLALDPRPPTPAAVPALVFGLLPIGITLVSWQLGLFVPYPILQLVSYALVAASVVLAFFFGLRGLRETSDGTLRRRGVARAAVVLAYVNGSFLVLSFGVFLFGMYLLR